MKEKEFSLTALSWLFIDVPTEEPSDVPGQDVFLALFFSQSSSAAYFAWGRAIQKVFLSSIDGGQSVIDRSKILDEVFIARGSVRVSDAALQLAQDFAASSGAGVEGRRVATFDWAQSIEIGDDAGAPPRQVGPCLILSAYDRKDVPSDCIGRVGRFEYAIRMPREVMLQAAARFIDVDQAVPFGLVLR